MAAPFAVPDYIPKLRPDVEVTDLLAPVHVYDIRELDGMDACVTAVSAFKNGLLGIINEESTTIHVYNSDRKHVHQFEYDLPKSSGICQLQKDHKNNLIFGTFDKQYILRYNLNGKRLPLFNKGDGFDCEQFSSYSCGLVVDYEGMMIINHSASKMNMFDLSSLSSSCKEGKCLFSGEQGIPNAGSLCLGPDGLLYFTCTNGVVALDKNGIVRKKFDFDDAALSTPDGIFVSGNGDIFTTDYDKHDVCVLSSEGEIIHSFGGLGEDKGSFSEPVGITIGYDGYVYVADSKNGRVQVF